MMWVDTTMTLRAIRSLQTVSPHVPIGVVAVDVSTARTLLESMPDPANIKVVQARKHFQKSNATQV